MRFFVAFLIAVSCLYFWDDAYNRGQLFDGLRRMGRDVSHNMGY